MELYYFVCFCEQIKSGMCVWRVLCRTQKITQKEEKNGEMVRVCLKKEMVSIRIFFYLTSDINSPLIFAILAVKKRDVK